MGYRKAEHPHKPRNERRSLQKTSTPGVIYMHEGQTMSIALPCFYREIRKPIPAYPHSRNIHDHIGWPDPRRPDHSCQDHDFARSCCDKAGSRKEYPVCHDYIDMGKLFPIHLKEEGYSNAFVRISPLSDASNLNQEILVRYGKNITVPTSVDDIEEFVSACEEAGVARNLVEIGVEYANQMTAMKSVKTESYIDDEDDWVVRVDLEQAPSAGAISRPCPLRVAAYVGDDDGDKDLVGVFRLTILPAAGVIDGVGDPS